MSFVSNQSRRTRSRAHCCPQGTSCSTVSYPTGEPPHGKQRIVDLATVESGPRPNSALGPPTSEAEGIAFRSSTLRVNGRKQSHDGLQGLATVGLAGDRGSG
jgi:hypothetical protein